MLAGFLLLGRAIRRPEDPLAARMRACIGGGGIKFVMDLQPSWGITDKYVSNRIPHRPPLQPFSTRSRLRKRTSISWAMSNNARYLNWVQDACWRIGTIIAPADDIASKAWVALKHEITYRKPAFLED